MRKIAHNIQKGDIWIVENFAAVGHAQKGIRPHVVVTQVAGSTVTVAPCTSAPKRKFQKYTVELTPSLANGLKIKSFVLLAQSFAADISLLQKKIGHLESGDVARIQIEFVKYVTE